MSKLYLQAIRALPERFVDDQTQVMELTNPRVVVAANPSYLPIMYAPTGGRGHKWKPLRLKVAAGLDFGAAAAAPHHD